LISGRSPKISLITAAFNSRTLLEGLLAHVHRQTHPHVEWLVIDGGSNDGTREFLEAQKDSIARWISEPDWGIYDALNKGVHLATGEVIGFLHSDDLLASPETLSRIAKCFQKTQAHGVYGDLQYVQKDNPNKVIRRWKSRLFSAALLGQGWMPPHPTLFLRREVYDKHGVFDLRYDIAADYDFMLRVLKDPELTFAYLPETITKMRVGGASNRSLKNILQKSREDWKIIREHRLGGWSVLARKNLSKISQFF
jgi:glycosyltransferase